MDNQNTHQETDILVLLDYFKKGIKGIFRGIGNFFKGIFTLIIHFLILIKKYWILIVSCILVFAIVGFFNKNILPPAYNYEMIVQPNFNSTGSLYQLVSSCDTRAGNPDDAFFKDIKSVRILPVKSLTEDVNIYYNTVGNAFSENAGFKQADNRDTIFFRQYEIAKFKSEITDKDYPRQIISIKSAVPLNEQQIQSKIIDPLENDPYYVKYRESYMKSIDLQTKYNTLNLQRIDTLLLALAKGETTKTQSQTLTISGEAKNNLETDLLEQSRNFFHALADSEIRKNLYSDVIRVIAPPSLVNAKSIVKRSTTAFALYGLLFSLFVIFGIQTVKFLNQYEKEHA